jgi:glycosyltransferase involved in cell wall biosynthesis
MAITEHGLYVLEREIEIFNAEGIGQGLSREEQTFFKDWWRRSFRAMGQLSYDLADRIVTLHEVNRQMQLSSGASAAKLEVVPNGIVPEDYVAARTIRDWSDRPFRVGLIGRVVSIKDVKTFLRAVQLASREVPLEAYVLGPTEEEPEYYRECQELAAMLGLGDRLTFTGRVDVKTWLARLDLNVLTSVSESQPLVILEASAAGVPSVASEVGCCRELLEGRTPEDVALGPSGLITPAASPDATARAIVALARDPARHAHMADAGIQRVERFYRQEDVYAYYHQLYTDLARHSTSMPSPPEGGRGIPQALSRGLRVGEGA